MGSILLRDRDYKIFEVLAHQCFQIGLNATELTRYLKATSPKLEGLSSLEKSLRRRLKQHEKARFLSPIRYIDEPKQCYRLTKKGITVVNEDREDPVRLKKRAQNLGYIKHSRLRARALLELAISLEKEPTILRHEHLETRLPLSGGRYFIPDAILGVATQKQSFIFYLEVDRVTESYRELAEKMDKYLQHFRRKEGRRFIECLLFIAPTLSRTKGILREVRGVLKARKALPLSSIIKLSYLPKMCKEVLQRGWIDGHQAGLCGEEDFQVGLFEKLS